MKTINLLSALTLILLSFSTFGQDDKPVKRIAVTDLYIHMGMFLEDNSYTSVDEFKTLAPQSDILNNIPLNLSQSTSSSFSSSSVLSVLIGIQFSDKQKTAYKANPLLRLGFNYSNLTSLNNRLHKEDRYPYDTLTSSQTGQMTFIDSINSHNYGMSYSSDQLRFDGSVIFRTNPASRWSIYSGLGVTAGISINAYTSVYHGESGRTETFSPNGTTTINVLPNSANPQSDNTQRESFSNKMNYGFSTYIPMGVDFRIGKNKEFWKRMHLFYEIKPAMNFTSIPELQTYTNVNVQHGLGLRVSWN